MDTGRLPELLEIGRGSYSVIGTFWRHPPKESQIQSEFVFFWTEGQMKTAQAMELLMREPTELDHAERQQVVELERLFRERRPQFTQRALDRWLSTVFTQITLSDEGG